MERKRSKTLLKFPCEFNMKIIGKKSDAFEIAILSIIKKHCKNLTENAIKQRTSSKANYLSLTVTITAKNTKQLENIYQDLKQCPHVVMTL